MSYSCSLKSTQTVYAPKNVVQFEKVQKPAMMGDLNAFSLTDPKYGTIVCFTADKAKKLRLYIAEQDEAIDKGNVTIDNANNYIKQLSK